MPLVVPLVEPLQVQQEQLVLRRPERQPLPEQNLDNVVKYILVLVQQCILVLLIRHSKSVLRSFGLPHHPQAILIKPTKVYSEDKHTQKRNLLCQYKHYFTHTKGFHMIWVTSPSNMVSDSFPLI